MKEMKSEAFLPRIKSWGKPEYKLCPKNREWLKGSVASVKTEWKEQ